MNSHANALDLEFIVCLLEGSVDRSEGIRMSSDSNQDEHATKKSRKNDDSVVVESVDAVEEVKKADEGKSDDVHGDTCVVCMDEGSEVSPILENHQCPQCAPGAWKICRVCNEALLSRLCPVCRSEYAPIVMHTMPGLPFKKLADSTLTEEEKSSLLYKFGIVRRIISTSNVCVWSPSKQRMFFSLPSKLVEGSETEAAGEETTYIVTSIPVTDEDAGTEFFQFSNKTWDAIENEVENGAAQAGESVLYNGAAQYILNATREDGHRLYTMLTPSDWDYMLNPNTSSDINDALKSIRLTILHHVESVIPKKNEVTTESAATANQEDKPAGDESS